LKKLNYLFLFTVTIIFLVCIGFNSYAGCWKQDEKGWRYYEKKDDAPAGTYIKDTWETICKKLYRFDKDGYMTTGWWHYENSNDWYYFDENGNATQTDIEYNGVRYYFDPGSHICINPNGENVSEFSIKYPRWYVKYHNLADDSEYNSLTEEEQLDAKLSVIDEFFALPNEITEIYLKTMAYYTDKLANERNIILYKKELIALSKESEFNQAKMQEIMRKLADELAKADKFD
jgi:lysozyme